MAQVDVFSMRYRVSRHILSEGGDRHKCGMRTQQVFGTKQVMWTHTVQVLWSAADSGGKHCRVHAANHCF